MILLSDREQAKEIGGRRRARIQICTLTPRPVGASIVIVVFMINTYEKPITRLNNKRHLVIPALRCVGRTTTSGGGIFPLKKCGSFSLTVSKSYQLRSTQPIPLLPRFTPFLQMKNGLSTQEAWPRSPGCWVAVSRCLSATFLLRGGQEGA